MEATRVDNAREVARVQQHERKAQIRRLNERVRQDLYIIHDSNLAE